MRNKRDKWHRWGSKSMPVAQFRMLGPLEVIVGDALLEISSSRERTVLAMLLLQAGHAVPLDRLVDAVWDEAPPATARSQVQQCVSALRRQLSRADLAGVIATSSAGYAIRVSAESIDATVFERLIRRSRGAVEADQLDQAIADLRGALALWRGPACADVPSEVVQAAATRLNEDRLGVLEDCLELELQLGRHRDVAAELGELVRQHPTRERLRAMHMLALYRSGRQAEALESFRDGRQILTEELGLDPGEELSLLQRAILANDRVLELRPQSPGTGRIGRYGEAVIPRQLPAAVADFTGREYEAELLAKLLSADGADPPADRYVPIVTLAGKGGAGKTTLALHVAHRLRGEYPDGQLFVQLRDGEGQPVSSAELLASFLRAFGVPSSALPPGLSELTALYRSLLGDRRILVVLDDAEDVRQLEALLPGNPDCCVIITSRHPLPGLNGAHHVEIGDLDEDTSVALLTRVIGPERVQAEPAATLELARLCGNLPLALRIVAAKLATRPHWRVAQMVRRMTAEERRLDELILGDVGIRATLSLSYTSLDADSRRLFLRLALLETADFGSWVAAPLLDADAVVAADLLDTLVEARLVEVRLSEDRSVRFYLHELVRVYALERLAIEESAGERSAALQRVLACWLSLAVEAHRRAYGGDFAVLHGTAPRFGLPADLVDDLLARPLSWLRSEHAGLVAAVLQASQAGLDELCWDLAMTLVTLFESDYRVHDWRKTHEAALEVCRRAGNIRGEAAMLYSLGNHAVAERAGNAHHYLDAALDLFDQLADSHGQALTLASMAFAARLDGHYDQAMARYEAAMSRFRAVGDRVGEADALTNMALIRTDQESFGVAAELLDQARAVGRFLTAPRLAAQTEYRRGEFYCRQGEFEGAQRSFRKVLRLVRENGDLVGEAYALQGLANVHTQQQQYAIADDELGAALDLSRTVGDTLVLGRTLLARADFCMARGDTSTARSLIGEALAVLGDSHNGNLWRARALRLHQRLSGSTGPPA
jgi:DNA-binding SARP family transcriptional activator